MASNTTKVGLHVGMALTNIIARTYPSLRDMVLEAVQNAIDANCRTVWIEWDERRRTLAIRDDGDGVGLLTMNARLQQICSSSKGEDDLGQFGIGVMAPLDKGERFTFTSSPRLPAPGEDGAYHRWTFQVKDIAGKQELEVPCARMGQMSYSEARSSDPGAVAWRTEVRVEHVVEDSVKGRFDPEDIKYQIQQRFSVAMRKKSVKVILTTRQRVGKTDTSDTDSFGPLDFTGQPLQRWTTKTPVARLVVVQLYLRRVIGRKQARVEVGESGRDYRVTLAQFLASAAGMLSRPVADALSSGLLEGEITAEGIRITPNRKGVEMDDALMDLCQALEKWHSEVGSHVLDTERSSRQAARYQQIAIDVLGELDKLLRDPRYADWRDKVRGFHAGTVGRGHTQPSDRSVIGPQVQTSVRVNRGGGSGGRSGASGSDRKPPQVERPDDVPVTVAGPAGGERTVVKRSSFGIQVIFDRMLGSADLWLLNPGNGELLVNIRHPHWAECERSDRELQDLLRHIVQQAMAWLVTPEDWRPQAALTMAEETRAYMFLRSGAAAARERGSGKGKGKKKAA